MAPTLVYVEQSGGSARRASLEALSAARMLGPEVVAVVAGPGAETAARSLGRFGASKVVHLSGADSYSPDGTAADLAAIAKDEGASACLAAASSSGKDVMPRLAALLDSVPLTDCTALRLEAERPVAVRPMLAGKVVATVASDAPVFCATLRPNVFAAREVEGSAEVVQVATRAKPKAVVTEVSQKVAGKVDVKEAPIVISGGRGLRGPEHFHLVEELAAAFGNAAVGASRAVVDAGWRPHDEQVGQTGKTVSPQLYIAVGISGAIQHLAGMRTAKVIVAINKDAAAPIFKLADYGIVGDAFEVLPALTAAVRELRKH